MNFVGICGFGSCAIYATKEWKLSYIDLLTGQTLNYGQLPCMGIQDGQFQDHVYYVHQDTLIRETFPGLPLFCETFLAPINQKLPLSPIQTTREVELLQAFTSNTEVQEKRFEAGTLSNQE
jgi:hypothetical protein